MLISSMGAISIFADGTETSVSATEKASSEASSTETELGEAIGKLKENIKKLEVKSFWERNKGTILKVTGGALAAAATGAALYLGYNYLWANGTPLVNPAGDQIGNPTEDPAVKSVQSQDPTATAAGTSANPAVDPAANSDQTPTPQVEGIQSKEAPVNTDVCLQEEENICLPVDKDIINTADVSADPSTNPAVNPSASQAETPIGKQADATPENQMSCDIASKEAEAALEDLKSAYLERLKNPIDPTAKNQYQKADERYISASNKVGKCNPIHLSGKEGMCLIDNKDTEADHSSTIPKTETIFCKENALEDATSKVWGGISSTASKGWKAMWDFDDAAAEYTYVGPVKATALVVGSLLTILGGKRMGLTPTKFMNALRRGGAAGIATTAAAASKAPCVLRSAYELQNEIKFKICNFAGCNFMSTAQQVIDFFEEQVKKTPEDKLTEFLQAVLNNIKANGVENVFTELQALKT
ncbi:MAG: hypothetical protein RUMPE_01353 [Eubacteriales bacterium SKADARSKE-1]|nr:hypothetical protein [Eubacteriales bacterium SKADARSKE-1]